MPAEFISPDDSRNVAIRFFSEEVFVSTPDRNHKALLGLWN